MKFPHLFHSPYLFVTLSLLLFASLCPGALYLFTEQGRLARSTNEGITWSWVSTPMPTASCIDMCSDPYHYIYLLSRNGEVYRSVDYGSSWVSRGNIPVFDAIGIWVITELTLVITESGDFYQRSNASGTWSLLGNVGASDCVDLIPHPASGFLVLTRSGDVYQVQTAPFSKSLIGNIGSFGIVEGATLTSAVLVVNEQGDVARSTNGGSSWSWVGAVSQLTVCGITSTDNGNLYMTTDAGEVLRSINQGSNWSGVGNVSQVGIGGIISDSVAFIGITEAESLGALTILGVYPNPSNGRFTICFRAEGEGRGRLRIFNILGQDMGTLWQGSISSGLNVIAIEKFLKGVYFLQLESGKARAVEKIILQPK